MRATMAVMSATRTDDVVRLLSELVAIPSINPEGKGPPDAPPAFPFGEARMADHVERTLAAAGLTVEQQLVLPGRHNVIARAPGADADAPPLLLEAHMDTVGVDGMTDPFVPRVEAGRLHGRGACDTKASLAAMMLALRRVVLRRVPLGRPVWLVAAADEEFGQSGIRALVASGVRPAAAIVGEPTSLKVVAAHKGQIYLRIVTRGRAAHTSVPTQGQNAIVDMAEVVRVLHHRAAAEYARRAHPLCGPPLLSVSVIEGGVSEHIVPDRCQIAIDLRTAPGQTTAAALEELRGWLDHDLPPDVAGRVTIEPPHHDAPPMETSPDHPDIAALARATEGVLGAAEITGVPYNTDAGALAAAGVPVAVFGPGDIAEAHTPVEFVELEQVVAAAEILERFLLDAAT
jgi:succinyl-diaminopimelate desuccinylase